jgi:hypothetical protein
MVTTAASTMTARTGLRRARQWTWISMGRRLARSAITPATG